MSGRDAERKAFDLWWGSAYVSQSLEEDVAWEAWQARAALAAQPAAWVDDLSLPQPHCVTDLKYCSAYEHEHGLHLKYTPLYSAPQPPAQPAPRLELGDRFMEILRAIHGDMPDAFADSARLAFAHVAKEAAQPPQAGELTVAEILAEFDRRAVPNIGFYDPHEPAEIIREMVAAKGQPLKHNL